MVDVEYPPTTMPVPTGLVVVAIVTGCLLGLAVIDDQLARHLRELRHPGALLDKIRGGPASHDADASQTGPARESTARREIRRQKFRDSTVGKAWGTATAIALAQALGLVALQWHVWWAAMDAGGWDLLLVGIPASLFLSALVFAGSIWFRFHRTTRIPDPARDYPINGFQRRQTIAVGILCLPVLQSVTGVIALAHAARDSASTALKTADGSTASEIDSSASACHDAACSLLQMADWRRDYFALLSTAVFEVVVIALLVAVAQAAIVSYFKGTDLEGYHHRNDPLYFAVLLSLALAVLFVPTWSLLQDAGHQMVAAQLLDMDVDEAWFTTRDKLTGMLAPAVGLSSLLAAGFGILSPIATVALTNHFSGASRSRTRPSIRPSSHRPRV